MGVVSLEHHNYDLLMKHKNPVTMRLNDAHHQQINVGDIVEYSGHNTIMDKQRFRVVDKMHHPTIHDAVNSIQHSNLSTRDKISMTQGFLGTHGEQKAASHQVVSIHLEPHTGPSGYNHSIPTLGH